MASAQARGFTPPALLTTRIPGEGEGRWAETVAMETEVTRPRCALTFPVDVVDERSQSHLDEVRSVAKILRSES